MANTKPSRRQRGTIRPNGPGFQVRVYAGRDPLTKKDLYLYEQATTRTAAEKVRTRLLHQIDEQRHPKSKVSVGFLLDRWLNVAEMDESSRERAEGQVRIYLQPTFGNLQAGKLTAEMLELFYARLRRCREQCDGRRNGKFDRTAQQKHVCRPLAANTVRKLHFILRPALDRGMRWGYVSTNVAALAEPPAQPKPNPDPPTPEEAALVLNAAWERDLDWGTFLFMTMVTGSRRGEMCALRWSDIDLDRLTMFISHSNTGRRIKDTKTHQRRKQSIDAAISAVLTAHKARMEERCKALGGELPRDSFVFSLEPDGSIPLLPPSVSQRYRRLANVLKIHTPRLKDLRAYNVTELLGAGADVRTVAGRVGHGGGGATTLKYYAAFLATSDRRAVTGLTSRLPVPDGILTNRPRATTVNGLRLACSCGNESLWAMVAVTEHGVDAVCAQCDTKLEGHPTDSHHTTPPPAPAAATKPAPAPWQRIADELRSAIHDGTLQPGQEAPTVADLAAAHGVAPSTAHRAIAELKREGLVSASRGRRVTVCETKAAGSPQPQSQTNHR